MELTLNFEHDDTDAIVTAILREDLKTLNNVFEMSLKRTKPNLKDIQDNMEYISAFKKILYYYVHMTEEYTVKTSDVVKNLSAKITEANYLYDKLSQHLIENRKTLQDICNGNHCDTFIMRCGYKNIWAQSVDSVHILYYKECKVCGKYEYIAEVEPNDQICSE
jgi:hypothetical protein